MTELALLLSPEFLVLGDDRGAPRSRGALAWLIELRRSGRTVLPAKATPALIEALARSHVDPLQLPEPLRYEVVSATPQPRIRMARSRRPQGHGTREELDAAIEFDYAGTVVPARPKSSGYDAERRRMVRRQPQPSARRFSGSRSSAFTGRGTSTRRRDAGDRGREVSRRGPRAGRRRLARRGGRACVPRGARLQMQVKSGVDWFELHGRSISATGGRWRSPSCSPRCAAARRR